MPVWQVSCKALSSLVLPLEFCLRQCLSLPSVCPAVDMVREKAKSGGRAAVAELKKLATVAALGYGAGADVVAAGGRESS
eukprot:SAG22_NODE_575_length_8991_cov_12.134859_13_plen_80_part_00